MIELKLPSEPAKKTTEATFDPRPDLESLAHRLQQILGSRFQVVKPLAVGGMATIYLLRHRLHHGLFVAKVLHPELIDLPGVLQSFRLEATHAALLSEHPNAVPVFDFGELDGIFFLLMPYVSGADLDIILQKEGPLGRDESLHMAAQISSLLSHAESQGVVHCDLTTGNIRRDNFGFYHLLDLGLSQRSGPQDRPFVGGTPLYSSPEQMQGQPLDIRSDLYSLGAVLGEAISGKPLFLADSLAEIRRRHLEGVWSLPPGMAETDPVALLLRKLLSIRPEDRPASAYELSGILHAFDCARPEFRPDRITRSDAISPPAQRRRLS